jgi:hypothetical protein
VEVSVLVFGSQRRRRLRVYVQFWVHSEKLKNIKKYGPYQSKSSPKTKSFVREGGV